MPSLVLSLRGRLLFLICLATLPAVVFAFVAAENERAAALLRTERDALHLADLASREHAHQVLGARELLSWFGAKLAQEGRPILDSATLLPALLAGHPQLSNIGVLSPDGEVLASAFPLASYRSWKDNPAYVAALRSREVVVGTYLVSPIFERRTLNHAYAVRDADGAVTAVVFNGLDLDWLSRVARSGGLPDGFSLLIADREGRVLASGGPAHADLAAADARVPDLPTLAASRRGRMLEVQAAGVARYFVAAPLEGAPGLFVAVGLPYERVVQDANRTFYRTLAGLAALTLFVVASVFTAAELGVLRGLRALARVAKRLGAGDLSARARAPRAHDELASLTHAFNTMADRLAARYAEALEAQRRLRSLAGRLQVVREEEAARISRELHDEIGQVLTSLKLEVSQLRSRCPPDEHERPCATALRQDAAAMSQQLDAAVRFVRRISSDLRPGVLDKLGLTAALEWQARELGARTGLAIQVDSDGVAEPLDERLSVTLFRVAQEALNNVVCHARAHTVELDLAGTQADVTLTVRDDGQGITTDAVESSESLGIIGMRERAMLAGGRLSLQGAPGAGTTVSVTIPRQPAPSLADAHPAG